MSTLPVGANVPERARAHAITTSVATLDDYFPASVALDLGLEGRPFALAGRRRADERLADPDLVVVTADGVLHRFVPVDGPGAEWREERFPLPELVGATILRVNASAQDPATGDERLVVTISAQTADRNRVFLLLERTAAGWSRLLPGPLPPDLIAKILSFATGTGFAGLAGGKLQAWYACLPPNVGVGSSLFGYAVDNQGEAYTLAFLDNPRGTDRLVAPVDSWNPTLARLENNVLTLYPGPLDPSDLRGGVVPLRFNFQDHARSYRIPVRVDADDASCLVPITDTRGLSHGMFVRTRTNELVAVSFADGRRAEAVGVITGLPGGPTEAVDVAYAFGDGDALHVFVTDAQARIWYANWARGARPDSLFWEPTGQRGRQIEAPQVWPGAPSVFVEGVDDRIDMITRSEESGEWTRTGVTIAEPVVDAEPTRVHAVCVSAENAAADPVGGAPVRVRADRPVVVEHEGRLYRIGPDRPIDLVTGTTGTLRFRVRARGVDAASLLVSSADLPGAAERVVRPQDGALRRLAGLDPSFDVTGPRLKAAGLLPATLGDTEAEELARAIRASARTALGGGARRALSGDADLAPVAVTVRRQGGGFHVVPGGEPAPLRRALGAEAMVLEAESTPGGFWSWLRGAWNAVVSFTVEVVEAGVRLVVEAGQKLVEFVARTARYIAEGIEALVAWLGELKDDLVDAGARMVAWVAERLGWDDVIRAKDAVRRFAHGSLVELEDVIGRAVPDAVSRGIGAARQRVDTLFEQAIAHFGDQPAGPREDVIASPARGQLRDHGAKVLAVQHAVSDEPVEAELLPLSPALKARLDTLVQRAMGLSENEALRDAVLTVARLFEGRTSVADGLGLLMRDLLAAVKPLVLLAFDVADVVQTALFELAAVVVRLFRTALETPVTTLGAPFRWVNALYRKISGGADLTLLDLGALLFVAPGVLLHHALTGRPVIDPATAIPETAPTAIAAFGRMLDAVSGANVDLAGGREPIVTPAMKAFFRFISPVYEVCNAAWLVLRSAVSGVENALRTADWEGVPTPATLRSAFAWAVRIADWGLVAWAVTEVVVGLLPEEIEGLVADNPQALLPIAIGGLGLVAIEATTGWVQGLKAGYDALQSKVKVLIDATVSLVSGAVGLVANFVLLVRGPGADASESEAERARRLKRFYLARGAGIWLQTRKFVQFGLPVGLVLVKSAEPFTVAIGTTLLAGNLGADQVVYLVGGVVYAVRAAV